MRQEVNKVHHGLISLSCLKQESQERDVLPSLYYRQYPGKYNYEYFDNKSSMVLGGSD